MPPGLKNLCGYPRCKCPDHEPDPIAIERLVNGDPPSTTTIWERILATAILASRGYSDAAIAKRIQIATRSVQRLRAKWGIPSLVAAGGGRSA